MTLVQCNTIVGRCSSRVVCRVTSSSAHVYKHISMSAILCRSKSVPSEQQSFIDRLVYGVMKHWCDSLLIWLRDNIDVFNQTIEDCLEVLEVEAELLHGLPQLNNSNKQPNWSHWSRHPNFVKNWLSRGAEILRSQNHPTPSSWTTKEVRESVGDFNKKG